MKIWRRAFGHFRCWRDGVGYIFSCWEIWTMFWSSENITIDAMESAWNSWEVRYNCDNHLSWEDCRCLQTIPANMGKDYFRTLSTITGGGNVSLLSNMFRCQSWLPECGHNTQSGIIIGTWQHENLFCHQEWGYAWSRNCNLWFLPPGVCRRPHPGRLIRQNCI